MRRPSLTLCSRWMSISSWPTLRCMFTKRSRGTGPPSSEYAAAAWLTTRAYIARSLEDLCQPVVVATTQRPGSSPPDGPLTTDEADLAWLVWRINDGPFAPVWYPHQFYLSWPARMLKKVLWCVVKFGSTQVSSCCISPLEICILLSSDVILDIVCSPAAAGSIHLLIFF